MLSPDQYNELHLFRQIAEGDEDAYTEVFHLYTPRLYPYLLKICRDEHLAKELLQETFLRLWINRADLEHIASPASWLFRIAANTCLSHLRKELVRGNLQERVYEKMRPAEFPVAERVEQKDLDLMVRQAVEKLPGRRKQVYMLSRELGLSHKEIADETGLSVNTVKNHLGLALKSIREYLHDKTGLSIVVLTLLQNF